MADRVRRPEIYEEMLDELRNKGVFKTYKDALMFAACLGYDREKRIEFSKSSEPVNLQIFSGEFNHTILNMLAVAETLDPACMGRDKEDEKVRIFEEYACGGLEILKNEFWDSKADWELGLMTLIMQEEDSEKILMDITGLSQD